VLAFDKILETIDPGDLKFNDDNNDVETGGVEEVVLFHIFSYEQIMLQNKGHLLHSMGLGVLCFHTLNLLVIKVSKNLSIFSVKLKYVKGIHPWQKQNFFIWYRKYS